MMRLCAAPPPPPPSSRAPHYGNMGVGGGVIALYGRCDHVLYIEEQKDKEEQDLWLESDRQKHKVRWL
jgi:hypothetical protein